MFAAGCIFAELYLMRPLFPGTSEIDQLIKICAVLRTPTQSDWPDGFKLAKIINFTFPKFSKSSLQSMVPGASPAAIDLMGKMLTFEPRNRISASAALQHPFFSGEQFTSLSIPNEIQEECKF